MNTNKNQCCEDCAVREGGSGPGKPICYDTNHHCHQPAKESYEERFKEEFIKWADNYEDLKNAILFLHRQAVEEMIKKIGREKKDKILEYSHTEARCLAVGFNEGLFKAIEIIKSKLL